MRLEGAITSVPHCLARHACVLASHSKFHLFLFVGIKYCCVLTCCMLTFPSSMSKGGRTEQSVRPMHAYDIIVIEPEDKGRV